MKNVVVTGANGFVGSSLIQKLVLNNINVVAIDVHFESNRFPKNKGIFLVETEINNVESLQEVIPNIEYDAFYHLAWRGVNGDEKSDPVIQLKNAEITMICARVAKNLGSKKFLCAGTVAERSIESLASLNQTSAGMLYGVAKHCTHLMLETYCKNIGLNLVWMQFSNIYGTNNTTGNLISYTLGQLRRGKEALFGPASQPYDFIYIDDLLEAIYRLGEKKTMDDCYFIGSGEPRILREYLYDIGKQYGRNDLIKIGVRPDDGIVYTMNMFKTEKLVKEIGEYKTEDFTKRIKMIVQNY